MKPYENEKENFSAKIVFISIIVLFLGIIIGYISYLISFDLACLFSYIKVIIALYILSYIFTFTKLHDFRYALAIGLIFGLAIYLVPHILGFYEVKDYLLSEGKVTSFGVQDYITLYLSETEYNWRFGSSSRIDTWIVELVKIIIIVGGTAFISFGAAQKPFSEDKDAYYEQTASLKYNKLETDNFGSLTENELLKTIHGLLEDKKRFEPIKDVKQDDLILFELDGDPKKILQFGGNYYLLNNDEYHSIKNKVKDHFSTKVEIKK